MLQGLRRFDCSIHLVTQRPGHFSVLTTADIHRRKLVQQQQQQQQQQKQQHGGRSGCEPSAARRKGMFDARGERRPETYTAYMRAQHEALYHNTPEEARAAQPGSEAASWKHNVDMVKARLPSRVKLRYGCDVEAFPTAQAQGWWQGPLRLDQPALSFLQQEPHGRLCSWARTFLKYFVTDTSALGILGAYPMFVLSTPQCRELLRLGPDEARHDLLDVGAGEGSVTACLAPLFQEVITTEVSAPMLWRLRRRGYEAHGTERPGSLAPRTFDVVSLLNVLDRCDHPISLLRECRELLAPGHGRLLLAVVIPYRQCRTIAHMVSLPACVSAEIYLCTGPRYQCRVYGSTLLTKPPPLNGCVGTTPTSKIRRSSG